MPNSPNETAASNAIAFLILCIVVGIVIGATGFFWHPAWIGAGVFAVIAGILASR